MTVFNPKVSIIIPVYNGSNYIREAIDSALSQTYKNIEVIVVNDGSEDAGKSEAIAKSYGEDIVYISKTNGGVASAVNTGITAMRGEYFSWLSHDDRYLPDKVLHQIEILKGLKDKKTILMSGFKAINESGLHINNVTALNTMTQRQLDNSFFLLFKECVHGCTLLIHKQCFDQVGYFRTDLKTTQDYECFFRLFRKFKTEYTLDMDVEIRYSSSQGSKSTPHFKERDEFWYNVVSNMSEEEMCNMYDSKRVFLIQTLRIFKNNPHMSDKTIKHLEGQLEKQFPNNNCVDKIKLYGEMSRLIYEVTFRMKKETDKLELVYQNTIDEQRQLIEQYEKRLLELNAGKGIKIIIKEKIISIKHYARRSIIAIVKFLFRSLRKLAITLGIKEYLKNTSIFKQLRQRGIIDKIRKDI